MTQRRWARRRVSCTITKGQNFTSNGPLSTLVGLPAPTSIATWFCNTCAAQMRKDFAMARTQTAEVADDQGAATTTIRMVLTARIQMTRHEAAMKASHSTMHVGSASATRGSTQQIKTSTTTSGQ